MGLDHDNIISIPLWHDMMTQIMLKEIWEQRDCILRELHMISIESSTRPSLSLTLDSVDSFMKVCQRVVP